MPELPEVETIKRELEKNLIEQKLLKIKINQINFSKKIFKNNTFLEIKSFVSQKIEKVMRKGKYLILLLENKAIIFHLGLTGILILTPTIDEDLNLSLDIKHLILKLEFEKFNLYFLDIRKFGKIEIINKSNLESYFSFLGKDALEISLIDFKTLLFSKNRLIKSFLLDQKMISGLGNIYTDEILFRSKISPLRRTQELSEKEIERLYRIMKEVLMKAIELKGSSIKTYVNTQSKKGNFQEEHLVYGKKGTPCPLCGNLLKYRKISQRGTTFCSFCQN